MYRFSTTMSTAKKILEYHGLKKCAEKLCKELSLKTMKDLSNLRNETIDTLTFLKDHQAEKLKVLCDACRRGNPDWMQSILGQRRQFSDDTNAIGQSSILSGLLTQLQHLNIGQGGLVEFECQQKYDSIIAQLYHFLTSEDLQSAIKCITSEDLQSKIKEIDDKWTGLHERQQVTLERLKEVVTTIRQGIRKVPSSVVRSLFRHEVAGPVS